ncbi:hypothetical protein INT47_010493 [Mucor saturninus]|uniref:FAM192A/Fyv6 N-terminal domain-containing protein n=1 Tax=Mucor saturninus TaxID=64648 RepID=A0A8H7V2V6_9FUNG|nr:hypothetical protein INT47_010493 [Mucor saturninus]
MSFNIKNSFVSRAIVEDDKQVDAEGGKDTEEVVIQEEYDPRTLFERLQEQRTLKEEKFAEESRLSNQIKRVDAEEAEFFRTLSDEKEKLDHDRKIKEELELAEYRQAVEARAQPVGPASIVAPSSTITTTAIVTSTTTHNKPSTPTAAAAKSKKSVKGGALFVKKRKHSTDDTEKEDNKKTKKASTTSLSLLVDYGDISDSD